MSYQERRSIVSLVSNVVIVALYTAFMIQHYPDAYAYSPEIFRFWGTYYVILIPVAIVGKILIAIIFAIVNAIITQQVEPDLTDERDWLFEMKSTRNSLYTFGIGFILAMATLVVEMPPTVMFVILICTGVVSEMVGDISQFYLYRRGS